MSKNSKTNKKQEKIMLITFIILLIIVVILSIITLKTYNKKKIRESNIDINVLSKKFETTMNLDISNLEKNKTKEYEFIVKNYNSKHTLENRLTYELDFFIKNQPITIKLYKNNKLQDLDEDLKLKDNSLSNDKKQQDKYKIIIEANNKIEKNSLIKIIVKS